MSAESTVANSPTEASGTAPATTGELAERFSQFRTEFGRVRAEIGRAIVGYGDMINQCLAAIFSQGHVLLEGVPGLGKTYLVKTIGQVLELDFGRVQCTPDLMPSDVLGTHIVGEDSGGHRVFRFEKGPVFENLLLVDEINRATPKTQAALLEAMQEGCVTAGGEKLPLPQPFFVLATQNPLEMEGTYPLPEAQLDRFFFKLKVPFPELGSLVEISRRTTKFTQSDMSVVMKKDALIEMQQLVTEVPVADPLTDFAARLVLATHPEKISAEVEPLQNVARYVSYGASPRGMQSLVRAARVNCLLDCRTAVSVDDIRAVALPALRHRIILNFEGEAESISVDDLVTQIIEAVPAPAQSETTSG